MRSAQGGDRDALDQLLRLHQDRVYGVCRRLAGNDADALDATQEALIAVVKGLPRFDGRSRFSTWVYRVATNACLDELRRRRRRPTLPLPDRERPDDAFVGAGGTGAGGAGAGRDGAGARAVADEVVDRIEVDRALAELPPEFRAAVVLRDLCGLDYAEIAEVLGIPPGTVRSRISRGRSALAVTLGGNPDRPDDRPTARS